MACLPRGLCCLMLKRKIHNMTSMLTCCGVVPWSPTWPAKEYYWSIWLHSLCTGKHPVSHIDALDIFNIQVRLAFIHRLAGGACSNCPINICEWTNKQTIKKQVWIDFDLLGPTAAATGKGKMRTLSFCFWNNDTSCQTGWMHLQSVTFQGPKHTPASGGYTCQKCHC